MTSFSHKSMDACEAPPAVDLEALLQENPAIDMDARCSACPVFEHMYPMPVQGSGEKGILVVLPHTTKGDLESGRYSAGEICMENTRQASAQSRKVLVEGKKPGRQAKQFSIEQAMCC